jgi:hypothetical protein
LQQAVSQQSQRGLLGSVLAARCLSLLSAPALRVRLDDASVCGVLETDWLWLFLTAVASPSLVRDSPETALLTLDCGRCEFTEEAVGGGMGEGSRRSWVVGVKVWVPELPWADSGLRKGGAVLAPWSLLLRSAMGLLVMSSAGEGPPRRSGGSSSPDPGVRGWQVQDAGLLGSRRVPGLRRSEVDDALRQHPRRATVTGWRGAMGGRWRL